MDLEPEGIVSPDTDIVIGNDPAVREIELLLEQGKIDEAIVAIDMAIESGQGIESDLLYLRGDACLGLGRAREAERQFREVLRGDPDCPASRCWLAMSLYLQWRFDEAEVAVKAARALSDALVDADVVAGCLLERLGDYVEADGLFERAATASPDKYSLPVRLSQSDFDAEVLKASGLLPDRFHDYLASLSVVVQAVPDSAFAARTRAADGEERSPDMLGLFDGKPLVEGEATEDQPLRATIYLFQRNLERFATGREDLSEQIRITLWRELGRYLGFDEGDMVQFGLG